MNNFRNAFEFLLPTKIVYGLGSIRKLGNEMRELGVKRPMIVTDQGIIKAGILNGIIDVLEEGGFEYTVFDGVEINPKDINVEAGAKVAEDFNGDCLIALGGGSPIDCAKAIGVLLAHHADNIKAFEGKTAATKINPPLITIPTTAGTGSELTFSSVITDTVNKYKMTIKSGSTAAKTAICDPVVTLTVPPMTTAATGVDALTHAIEGYTALCSEPISDAVALYAIELINGNLVKAVECGDDLDARSAMLMGSMLAGISFSHSDVASVHCIAEALGSLYDLPHGMCNAIFLPYVMEYNLDYCKAKYARVARAMGCEYQTVEQGAIMAVEKVKQLTRDVNLPTFSSLGVNQKDYDLLAGMSERNGSNGSNPRAMTKADYITVLENAANERKTQI